MKTYLIGLWTFLTISHQSVWAASQDLRQGLASFFFNGERLELKCQAQRRGKFSIRSIGRQESSLLRNYLSSFQAYGLKNSMAFLSYVHDPTKGTSREYKQEKVQKYCGAGPNFISLKGLVSWWERIEERKRSYESPGVWNMQGLDLRESEKVAEAIFASFCLWDASPYKAPSFAPYLYDTFIISKWINDVFEKERGPYLWCKGLNCRAHSKDSYNKIVKNVRPLSNEKQFYENVFCDHFYGESSTGRSNEMPKGIGLISQKIMRSFFQGAINGLISPWAKIKGPQGLRKWQEGLLIDHWAQRGDQFREDYISGALPFWEEEQTWVFRGMEWTKKGLPHFTYLVALGEVDREWPAVGPFKLSFNLKVSPELKSWVLQLYLSGEDKEKAIKTLAAQWSPQLEWYRKSFSRAPWANDDLIAKGLARKLLGQISKEERLSYFGDLKLTLYWGPSLLGGVDP